MALKHSLAEKVMKWQYLNEQKSWVTGEKKIVKEEEWNPEINMDDAWSLLDGFIECVVRKRISGVSYRSWGVLNNKEYASHGNDPKQAIINLVRKAYNIK